MLDKLCKHTKGNYMEEIRIEKYNELSHQWNYQKNQGKNPSDYTAMSGKKVWWICDKGHEWESRISDRMRGNGCPYCSGKRPILGETDLKSKFPDLVKEWNYNKNNRSPEEYCSHSGKKVWWKCLNGHEWQATIDSRTRKSRNGCPYCAGQKAILGYNDLQTKYPDLCKEWDYQRNGNLKPTDICYSSGKRVWWKCKNGHSWYLSPNSRITNATGCAKCSEELRTSFPEQAILYYLSKMGMFVVNRKKIDNRIEIDIYLEEYKIGIEYDGCRYHKGKESEERESRKDKYCEENGIMLIHVKEIRKAEHRVDTRNCKYRYLSSGLKGLDDVISRVIEEILLQIGIKTECDICTVRDSIDIHLQYITMDKNSGLPNNLEREWNYQKNKGITPRQIALGSHKKVWWKCLEGHEWQAAMYHRVKGIGCPYCSGKKVLSGYNDFETKYPKLAEQWNYERNGEAKPSMFTAHSGIKVWWKCIEGHEWEATINKRSEGKNCPYCSGKKVLSGYNDFMTKYPEVAKEWDYERNGEAKPSMFTAHSAKKVWWKCIEGHEWQATINRRSTGRKCPYCLGYKEI